MYNYCMCVYFNCVCEGFHGGIFILGGWNRGAPHTKVSSFQGIGIPVYTEVSPFQSWNREVPLYTESGFPPYQVD